MAVWEEQLCASRVLDNEAVRVRHSAAFVRVQDFLAKFAAEIVVLQKQNLREVVMCSQAKTYAGRKKSLLEDWEFLLCDTSALESVAFLPRLQRSFQRAVVFLSDHCEVLTKTGAKNLQVALQTKTMQELPVSTFSRVFLESYTEQLSREQMEAIALWEKNLCEFSTADRAALSARFVRVQEFLAKFADEIVILQKQNLRSVVMSNQAHKHAEWAQAQNLFRRDYAFPTEKEICLLEDWSLCFVTLRWPFCPEWRRVRTRRWLFCLDRSRVWKG